jgi:phosphoglucomutase
MGRVKTVNWKQEYTRWLNNANLDIEVKNQLLEMQGNEQLIEDCYYKSLEFGTGGLRGELGPGINRLNIYTVRKATEGLAQYIIQQGEVSKNKGVVIAYDSRHKSPEFSIEAAKVLGKYGIRVYLFDELKPTPLLSFAVRHLGAAAGIVITASHNPPEYNGYKVYGATGCQITLDVANKIISTIREIDDALLIEVADEKELLSNGTLKIVGEEIEKEYLSEVKSIIVNPDLLENYAKELKIVFTPIHGTSKKLVQKGLNELGFTNVTIVKEQEQPDPNFSTVASPNPEEHAAFELAIQCGESIDADILIGTDPDADRVGVVVKDEDGKYKVLTGNQTGALMLDYLLSNKKTIPSNGVVLKTIVTSEIGRVIAAAHNLETIDTLTGFKFIGEKINEFEKTKQYQFMFGYEESYGCLIGDFVRDKDAIQVCLFIAEVAAYQKSKGLSLDKALQQIFIKYGHFYEDLQSITLKGKDGLGQMNKLMTYFRSMDDLIIEDANLRKKNDYQTSESKNVLTGQVEKINLPSSDVLKFILSDDSWFCVRPSGTEPKIKFYFGVKGSSNQDAENKLTLLKDKIMNIVNELS